MRENETLKAKLRKAKFSPVDAEGEGEDDELVGKKVSGESDIQRIDLEQEVPEPRARSAERKQVKEQIYA